MPAPGFQNPISYLLQTELRNSNTSLLVIVDLLYFATGNVVTYDLIGKGAKFKGFRNPLVLGDYLFLTPSLYDNIKLGSGTFPKIRIKF